MIIDFSKRMRELRLNMHLRQEQVANLVGVTKNAISTYENGSRQPSFAVAHVGVSDVTYTKAKPDRKGGIEYEYTVRAADFVILEYDLECDD